MAYIRSDPSCTPTADEVASELRDWRAHYWLRNFPGWPEFAVSGGKSAVCEQTERINDVMDEALLSRCHESPQHLLSVLMKVVGDYVDSVPAVHEVCPLYTPDEDEFIDWLKEGRAYGFVEVPGEAAE